MFQDLRFGLRMLWKERGFTITALLTLALCIGGNTAIFTLLNAVLFNPLPFAEPDRLVTMYNIYPGVGVTDRGSNGVPDYLDRRQLTDVFDSVALVDQNGYDVGSGSTAQRLSGEAVTPSFFRVLRVSPVLGRAFTEEESVIGNDKYAVLGHGLWKELFAGEPNVLGKDIRLSGVPYRIIGVMPEGFGDIGSEAKIWLPQSFTKQQMSDDARHNNNWGMIARLKPGVSVAAAQSRIDRVNAENLDRFPKFREILKQARFGTKVVAIKDELVRDVRPTLYLLQAAVLFVLLIGCVNVANLMLVRCNVRMKELAIRASLGASRRRLGRQLLTESVVLSLFGGLLGIAVAFGAIRLLMILGAKELPRAADIHINGTVLLFTAAVAVVTGLAFGSVPIVQLFRRDLNQVFRQTERSGTTERRAAWARSALVVCQVSLAFVLLIGAGLLTFSFARLLTANPGFDPEHVMSAQFSLPGSRYKDDAQARQFLDGLLERIRALPGVKSAGATNYLPFTNSLNASVITIVGRPLAPGELPPVPSHNVVDSGFFRTMGIPVISGRAFAGADGPDTPPVAVIDQFLARKYWPRGDAIGSVIRRGIDDGDKDPYSTKRFTVVGIVGDVKNGDLAEQNPVGHVYFYYQQEVPRTMHVVVKTERDSPQVASAIRAQLMRSDPELPLFDVKSMPERVSASLVNRRAAMIVCLVFAALALALSAVGIYGVLAYTVTQRTREFGIRMALGAQTMDVLGMVAGHGLRLTGIGLAIGVIAALAVTRLMTTLLYDVRPSDPVVFLVVVLSLAMVALIASLIPSVRALRIRPAEALRCE